MSALRNNFTHSHSNIGSQVRDALQINGFPVHPARSRSPNALHPLHLTSTLESELGAEDDPKSSIFKDLLQKSEQRFEALFGGGHISIAEKPTEAQDVESRDDGLREEAHHPKVVIPSKRPARAIDENNYDDEDSEGEDDAPANVSPLKAKSTGICVPPALPSTPMRRNLSFGSAANSVKGTPSSNTGKSSEDVRKRLEEDKKATEDAAKRSFYTQFHTIESDRDAMLDQKKLEELDRQVDVDMNGSGGHGNSANHALGNGQQGTLSQANLGASSLTLKHLIARIDSKRNQVKASDAELRSLMSEVRKNRSKWNNEEKVGQEELYEAIEKVLSELKAMTEHSTAFLTRVNKREAPDYYNGIVDSSSPSVTC